MQWRSRVCFEQLESRQLLATAAPLVADYAAPPSPLVLDAVSVPVTQATATTLELSTASSKFGQSITLKATVQATSGTPTGFVAFMDGQRIIRQVQLDSSGVAQLLTADFDIGQHSITAAYGGDSLMASSTSAPTTLIVRRSWVQASVSSSSTKLPLGQEVTFTATVQGGITGRNDAAGTLIFRDGRRVLGYSMLSNGTAAFTASTLTEGKHSISVSFGGDAHYTGTHSAAISEAITHATVVDLMALYTRAAATEAGGDQAAHETIVQAVRDTNTALSNSRVPVSIRLVYDGPTRYTESGEFQTDLDRLSTAKDGYMDQAISLRDDYGADLVTLFEADGDVGGLAYTLQYPRLPGNDELGFSVVLIQQATAPNYTLAHELGHNFGAVHDLDNASDPGVYSYSYGYRFWADGTQYHDIMAYDPGQMIPYYSNPAIKYQGVPIGDSTTSNVARTISQTAPLVSRYRKTQMTGTVATATQLSGPASSVPLGQRITFTATVTAREPDFGLPTGKIVFYDGNRVLGSGVLSGGKATWRGRSLRVGSHSISAVYLGDDNFADSDSDAISQRIV